MRRSWWRRACALVFGLAILAAVAVVPAAAAGGKAARPAVRELQKAPNATAKDEGSEEENEALARAEQASIIRTPRCSSHR